MSDRIAADGAQQEHNYVLLGMGNPLLDLQISVPDLTLHQKYALAPDGAALINNDNSAKLLPIFDDISSFGEKVEFVPGGSAQNTMRVCQWMLKAFGGKPKSCCYFGAVGKDKYGDILREKARSAGIEVRYQEIEGEKSGTCAVLICGTKRSLVAHLGAAEHFTHDHLNSGPNKEMVEQAKNFYVEGYFLTVSPDAILCLAKNAASSDLKHFAMNLSAEYICQFFGEPLHKVLPYVDILFGNETEAKAYATANGFLSDVEEDIGKIALRLAEYEKINNNKKRVVVITQGSLPVLVAHNGKLIEFPVARIGADKIVDTNGAGDAFCGGFLAALSVGRPLPLCVQAGNFAARTVIQHSGCTFPTNCDYSTENVFMP